MSYSFEPDEILVQHLRADEHGAFGEIYERYWRKLTSLAIFKTNSRETGEEIVQELFISLWEKRGTASILHLESYLFTSLRYSIISHLRYTIASRKFAEAVTMEISPVSTDDFLTVEVLQSTIEKTITQLPEKTQRIFKMSRFDERSHKEIAASMDITEKAVEYHITQSLKMLRESLKDYLPLVLLFHFTKNFL